MTAFDPTTALSLAAVLEDADGKSSPAPWTPDIDSGEWTGKFYTGDDKSWCTYDHGQHVAANASAIATLRNHAAQAAAQLRAACGEVERLNTRQQELLATIVRVTNETPYPDEIRGWQSQRSAMIAEVGSLKAEVIGLKRALLDTERNRDRCMAAVVESGAQRDSALADLARLREENERLRTEAWAATSWANGHNCGDENRELYERAGRAEAENAQHAKDWTALLALIAQTVGTTEDREAAEMGEIEEFDPWHALRTYSANRDSLAAALAASQAECERMRAVYEAALQFPKACGGKPVALAWFSPTCTHFSKAKGSPLDESSVRIRGLAWVAVRWAAAVRPRVIAMENVEEFRDWGPLDRTTNQPIAARRGQTFRAFVRKLEKLGYVVEHRILRACDYGAPTTRRRLFLVARCDGQRIVWPTPTHGPLAKPYRTAAECIDWSVPVQSIFQRDKPLAEKTLARVHRGLKTFVLDARDPYVVTDSSGRPFVPYLVHRSNGERVGQAPRIYDVRKPLGTVVAQGEKHALCVAFLAKHYGGNESRRGGSALDRPLDTITTIDHHALVAAFLIRYNGTSVGQSLREPLSTIDTRDRFGLVTVVINGESYVVDDIAMRMLTPRELFRAQGFGDEYRIDPVWNGKPLSKTAQIRMVGNSVSPPIAAAVVRAQLEAA